HGHSLADSHAAAVKKVLRTQYNTSQLQRLCPSALALYWGPANAAEVSSLLHTACSNTQPMVFPFVDRDEQLKPNVRSIKGIKSKHCFVYQGGTCRAYERTGEGEGE